MPRVGVVVIHWNAGAATADALRRLAGWTYPRDRIEVVVWDNASFDGSGAATERATAELDAAGIRSRYVRVDVHPGPSAAVNGAIRALRQPPDYVFKVDNDVTLDPGALATLVETAEARPETALFGPRLMSGSLPGTVDHGPYFFGWPYGSLLQRSGGPAVDWKAAREPVGCDILKGSAHLMRYAAVLELGRMYDPTLYFYHEEMELAYRLARSGHGTLWVPAAEGLHGTGLSTSKRPDLGVWLHWRNAVLVPARVLPPFARLAAWARALPTALRLCVRRRDVLPLAAMLSGFVRPVMADDWFDRNCRRSDLQWR